MRILALCAVLAAATPALARPPKIPNYKRIDMLYELYLQRGNKLRQEEAFRAKPRMERMILTFGMQRKTFENKKLSGKSVCEAVLEKWKEVQDNQISEQDKRILNLLPEALKANYAGMNAVGQKEERYKASEVLVDALDSKYLPIRKVAIDSLQAIYGTINLYRATAQRKDRKRARDTWKRFIKRKRR